MQEALSIPSTGAVKSAAHHFLEVGPCGHQASDVHVFRGTVSPLLQVTGASSVVYSQQPKAPCCRRCH